MIMVHAIVRQFEPNHRLPRGLGCCPRTVVANKAAAVQSL